MERRQIKAELIERVREFHARGWVMGSGGNFSAVLSAEPLCLAITATGLDKGWLDETGILEIDDAGNVLEGSGMSSAETLLHLAIVRARACGAVLHTHSVWGTLLSETRGAASGLTLTGYEMLKGLEGVRTHEHCEWLPILENSQDMPTLASQVTATLAAHPACHGILLRRHGLYTWGADVSQAARHVEIFEFLFEVVGRMYSGAGIPGA